VVVETREVEYVDRVLSLLWMTSRLQSKQVDELIHLQDEIAECNTFAKVVGLERRLISIPGTARWKDIE
jgi:hypothetical protein